MKHVYELGEELAETVSFQERAKKHFLLSLDLVKTRLLGEEPSAELGQELDVLWFSFSEKEMDRMNEMSDSLNGMLCFLWNGVGVDPEKPVGRNSHGGWINL